MTERANIANVATEQEALDHLRAEMAIRDLSAGDVARVLAAKGIRFSSETLSRNLRTGHLTDMVRDGIAVAFDWPADWIDNLPPLSQPDPAKRLGSTDDITQRLERIEELVGLLLRGQESGLVALYGLLHERLPEAGTPQQTPRRAAQ